MITNTDMTVYNKYISSGSAMYQRTVIPDVHWEAVQAMNQARFGNLDSNKATVLIPAARGEDYLDPIEWEAQTTKTGTWTLHEGDVIVKGNVTDEITGSFTLTSLKKKYSNVLVIESVDFRDLGSSRMHHWEVGAK